MCDPMTIAGGLAAAGGTYYNNQTQRNHINAVNEHNTKAMQASEEARRAERERQQALRREQLEAFSRTAKQADPGKERAQLDGRQEANLAENAKLNSLPMPSWLDGAGTGGAAPMSGRANQKIEGNKGQLAAQNRMRGAAQAAPGAGLALARGAADMGFLSDFMQGSMDASMRERQIAPPTVTPGQGFLGDLLLAGGSLGLQRGGYNTGYGQTSQHMPGQGFR